MYVPFVVTCDACQARLTVKKASLVGKRVACPGCQTPIIIRPPNEAIEESSSESVADHLPKIVTTASGIAVSGEPVTGDSAAHLPNPIGPATPLEASPDSNQPAPVAPHVDVPELSGIPVIREVAKPTRAAKHSPAGKKKEAATLENNPSSWFGSSVWAEPERLSE